MTSYQIRIRSNGELVGQAEASGEELLALQTKVKDLRDVNGSGTVRYPEFTWKAGEVTFEATRIFSEISTKVFRKVDEETILMPTFHGDPFNPDLGRD